MLFLEKYSIVLDEILINYCDNLCLENLHFQVY
jgi:hypothetical protein